MDLRGSETEKNLKTALVGESLARNKYTFYANSILINVTITIRPPSTMR